MTGAEFSGVDIDLLADYIGGALEGTPDESAVATLIAEDPAWHSAYETLNGGMAQVQAELGRLGPEPMPAEVAARIDGMFSDPPRLTVVQGDAPAKPRSRRMRWATPIAIAAGFIAFVGFGADYLSGRSSDNSQNDAASSAAGQSETVMSAPGSTTLATGIDYTRSTLAVDPPQPMSAPKSDAPSSASALGEGRTDLRADGLTRLHDPEALQRCLQAIESENADGPIEVQTVDYARFEGDPALIVRFTSVNGGWAWAAGPACGAPVGDADTIDKVPVR